MKWENIKKNEKKILIVSAIAVILTLVIGASYAFIAYTTRQKEINVLETDCIHVTMEELTNRIQLKNAYPVTDEVGETSKPFRFKLTNTCGVGVDYDLNLEVMGLANEKSESNPEGTVNRIASKNIATKVDELEKTILNPELYPEKVKVATPTYNQESDPAYDSEDYTAVEAYTLYSGEIKPYDSVTHEIRIWLDASAGNDSQNGSFYSKVVIDARQNQVAVYNFADFIMEKSKTLDSIEVFEHDETEQTEALTDYRYVGSSPDNYVYFGCEGNEENPCTNDNLYRIIGVIPTQSEIGGEYENRVKLIKATNWNGTTAASTSKSSSGYGYKWTNDNSGNNWEGSSTQKSLNAEYWDSLGDYKNYIDLSVWYLGAIFVSSYDASVRFTPNEYYTKERSTTQSYSKGLTSYLNNIGLMYPSDYGYSIGHNYVNLIMYDYNSAYISNSWLYNAYEWSITTETASIQAFPLPPTIDQRIVYSHLINYVSNIIGIRPTFYLNKDVIYVSGEGSSTSPFRISID